MSMIIEALFESVRTLSLAKEYLPDDRLASIADHMARIYVENLPASDKSSFLESFELIKEALTSKHPTDEDEDIIRLASYNLRQMEKKLYLNYDQLRDNFMKEIESVLGRDLANLVVLFERSIISLRRTHWKISSRFPSAP